MLTMEYDVYVDAIGAHCPTPILQAKKALSKMCGNQVLRIDTTDTEAAQDLAVFAKQTGHTLLQQSTNDAVTSHWLRKRVHD